MNKLFLMAGTAFLALAAVSMPADAQTRNGQYVEGEVTPLSGFYAGGFGGFSWTEADVGASDLDLDGGDYGIFVGYQLDAFLDRTMGLGINGAIEGHYAWSDADDSATIGAVGFSAEKDHEWGVSFRPGLSFVDDVMPLGLKPYGILGYRYAEFEATAPGVSGDEDYDGFELGIGTELIAYEDFGIRVDYSHVFYGDEDGVDLDEDDLRLGVAFHF